MKAPVPGRCKTRLSPPLTFEQAAELYKAFCLDVITTCRSVAADLWIAYDPSPDHPTPAWAAESPFFKQSRGPLGKRLIHAFNFLFDRGYERVAVIGTDAPQVTAERIAEAFLALNRHGAVLGPAIDGGYYLVALDRPRPALFRGIPWSTENVLAATRSALARENLKSAFLATEGDVDTPADVRRLIQEFAEAPSGMCPQTQKALAAVRALLLNP